MRKPQRSPPQIRAAISRVAAAGRREPFGMPNKAEGNPDEGNLSGDYLVWEYDNIDLEITFRHTQAGWVVKTWSID